MGRATRGWMLSCLVFGPVALMVNCFDLASLKSGADDLPDAPQAEASDRDVVDVVTTDAPTADVPIPPDPEARAALYKATVLASDPVAYWRFEEDGGTIARDERGAFDGTYVNAQFGAGLFGPGGAIVLATDGHVVVNNAKGLAVPTESFTLEAWVKPAVPANDPTTFMSTMFQESGWLLRTNNGGNLEYRARASDASPATNLEFSGALPNDAFHHIVVTYDRTALVGYLDGYGFTPKPATPPAGIVEPLFFGCARGNQGGLVNCPQAWTFDEFAIYPTALSADVVKEHYRIGHAP